MMDILRKSIINMDLSNFYQNKDCQKILKILNNNNAIEVYIRADKGVIFGEVAKLMSLLQELKPDSINFITEPIND